ncbi:ethanolamine-phosphate cytidylyltransferase [Mucor circinelloides 1006PhL]|uniref:ethanolamine-phosphate cytidylyltransferase n=1 Tax=Mucor circinelloides f. circinelloides (strain 1006PhL) TaxID=1220926 RepID=S2JFT0_MUCC1|nr:ethanolamine-phosphate cytidylyltransferase [Mucor circinelloides 1006PhL]
MHYGHANALRQAKSMGDILVVGVHSDADIEKNKGPTHLKHSIYADDVDDRYAAVAACKWVDEVVPNAPYNTTVECLKEHNIDFCVHGDDITTMADGTDCYQAVKDAGLYRECKRTEGVSTTELVGRMLLMTRDHHKRRPSTTAEPIIATFDTRELAPFSANGSKVTTVSHFLPTSRRIVQFSEGREPKPTDKVVYVDGTFDLFHVGHIEFLKRAKALGDFLIVGVHDDQTVNAIKGSNYPLMNLHERALSVLACRYVDEVIIGAPYSVTEEILNGEYKVALVAHGNSVLEKDMDGRNPYDLPKKLGIYKEIDTPNATITTEGIINRIIENRKIFEERQRRKNAKAALERQKELEEKKMTTETA